MGWFTKPVSIPAATEQITGVELWEVRWMGRYGSFNSETRPEVAGFPTEEEANKFAQALRNAFALLRHTGHNVVKVTVEKTR